MNERMHRLFANPDRAMTILKRYAPAIPGVYFVWNGEVGKIGIAGNIRMRLRDLHLGQWTQLELIRYWKGAGPLLETYLKQHLLNFRLRRSIITPDRKGKRRRHSDRLSEWFTCDWRLAWYLANIKTEEFWPSQRQARPTPVTCEQVRQYCFMDEFVTLLPDSRDLPDDWDRVLEKRSKTVP